MVTQAELVDHLRRLGHPGRLRTARLVRTILEVVADHLRAGGRLRVRGLGTLAVVRRPARSVRHPGSGRQVQAPARLAVVLRPSRVLMAALRRRGAKL